MELLAKIVTSKTGITILLIGVAILSLYLAWHTQIQSLTNKITSLQKVVDNQNQTIVELETEIGAVKLELQTAQKGIAALEVFTQREKEILQDGNKIKTDILDAVQNSEENQSWWNTPVPDDLIDAILCN